MLSAMGKRRTARERALQFLFQYDLNPSGDVDAALNQYWECQTLLARGQKEEHARWNEPVALPPPTVEEAAMRLFADDLVRGVLKNREEIDRYITKYAKNWELPRMAIVDRNVLRLAVYEMLHREDIPPIVSINEAVDIAKKYSTEDSGKFVNGILDKVKADLLRPARLVP